jgi:hypothetical protein
MPIVRRKPVIGRQRRRILDPERPLFVTRRIGAAHDPVTGVQTFLVPGDVFDAKSVAGRRLETLFAGRYIGHDRPRGAPPVTPAAPVVDLPIVEATAVDPPKGKRPRAGA